MTCFEEKSANYLLYVPVSEFGKDFPQNPSNALTEKFYLEPDIRIRPSSALLQSLFPFSERDSRIPIEVLSLVEYICNEAVIKYSDEK